MEQAAAREEGICGTHPMREATHECVACGRFHCHECFAGQTSRILSCTSCGGLLQELERWHEVSREDYWESLRASPAFPFTAGGAVQVVGAAACITMPYGFLQLPFVPPGLVASVIVLATQAALTGYVVGYTFEVCDRVASGEDEMSDFSSFEDMTESGFRPLVWLGGVWLFSFGPAALSYVFLNSVAATIALFALGTIAYPMFFLRIAQYRDLTGLGGAAWATMTRHASEYAALPALFFGAALLAAALGWALSGISMGFAIFVAALVMTWAHLMLAYATGVFYRTRVDEFEDGFNG